jgi:hypothetical protein
VSFAYFTETPGCEVSGPQPAILLAYAFHAWRIVRVQNPTSENAWRAGPPRRAKTDRLDTELLKRAFLGWLRGERDHCKMVAIPTTKDEDAKRPNRERHACGLFAAQARPLGGIALAP